MPSNTPGVRNGIQVIGPIGQRQVASAMTTTSAAATAENIAELKIALCPALNAGKNSSHVRSPAHKSTSGNPTDKPSVAITRPPLNQNQPAPSCRRKTLAGTPPSSRGQEMSRRRSQTKDRKSTRLNSSHSQISYAVFCLKKKKKNIYIR